MSNFPARHVLSPGQEKAFSTRKTTILGAIAESADGRVFRYALNGGTSIAGAQLVQTAVAVGSSVHASALLMSTVAHGGNSIASGVTTISLIMVTTNVSSANMYADGYLHVSVGPGSGVYLIKGHASGASASVVTFELYGGDKTKDAFSTVTNFGVRRNPYDSVVVAAATPTGGILGVTPVEIPANNYFWLQTGGVGSLNADTLTTVAGGNFLFSGSSAGHAFAATSNPDHISFPVVAEAITGTSADIDQFVKIKIGA